MLSMGLISILVLFFAIFLGFRTKINTGLLAILFAFVIGFFILDPASGEAALTLSAPQSKARTLISGWDSSLFFMILGTTLLFTVARLNQTLEIVAHKLVALARGKTRLVPLLFFALSCVISAVGPGNIATCALIIPIAMAVAKEEGIDPLLMAGTVIAGSNAGALSPIAPTGIVALNLAQSIGLATEGLGWHLLWQVFKSQFVLFVVLFFALKGHRLPWQTSVHKEPVHLNKEQLVTLLVISLAVFFIVVFDTDVGFTGFAGTFILLLCKVADEKSSILGVPWGTIVMVCGVGVLVNVVKIAGGVDLMAEWFASIMTPRSAKATMTLMGSLLSTVASSSGVVLPTLIPTVPSVVESLGADPRALVAAIIVGSHMVTNSPFSTLGGLAMAAASAEDLVDKNKFYLQLLLLGIVGIFFGVALAVIGLIG